jgi:hypothetical protein
MNFDVRPMPRTLEASGVVLPFQPGHQLSASLGWDLAHDVIRRKKDTLVTIW